MVLMFSHCSSLHLVALITHAILNLVHLVLKICHPRQKQVKWNASVASLLAIHKTIQIRWDSLYVFTMLILVHHSAGIEQGAIFVINFKWRNSLRTQKEKDRLVKLHL